jgi:hypothetical protein
MKKNANSLNPQPATLSPQSARPQIDLAKRQANRALGTTEVLHLLRSTAPALYEQAEVVGKWVWIQFADKQPSQITAALAQLGFHWNNLRQAWQHPCGALTKGSQTDPREKYGSYSAADKQADPNPYRYDGPPRTAEQVAA